MSQKNTRLNDLVIALISLLLAIFMWINMSGQLEETQGETQRVYPQIPLIHENVPRSMKVWSDNYLILVTLAGMEEDLDAINPNYDIKVRLDLSNMSEGTFRLPLSEENVILPDTYDNLRVLDLTPQVVEVTLEEYATIKLPVRLRSEGSPADNFVVVESEVIPPQVTLTGPSKTLTGLERLESEVISIQDADGTLQGPLRIPGIPPNAVVREINTLRYRIKIEEKKTTQTYDKQFPVFLAEGQDLVEATFSPETVQLEVLGPISAVEWFNPDWVVAEVIIPTLIEESPLENPELATDAPASENETETALISSRWTIPEEVKSTTPEWAQILSTLDLTWKPAQVEVNKP
jgi:hypothetical protein